MRESGRRRIWKEGAEQWDMLVTPDGGISTGVWA